MNGHVRRIFNLEGFVEPDNEESESDESESERSYRDKVRLLPKK